MKKLILTQMNWKEHPCRIVALEENGKLMELHLESPEKEYLLGSIHIGKVQRVLPNIKGAFVEIENRVPCFYPYSKNQHPIFVREKKSPELKAGDELLVQVTQEALKTKAPCVSCNLSFPGTYLILTTENKTIGVSGKISAKKRQELKILLENALGNHQEFGVIVRTNAAETSPEHILNELKVLQSEMQETIRRGMINPCFTKIKTGSDFISSSLKSVYWDELESIVTDDADFYGTVTKFVNKMHPAPICEIKLYQDKLLPLYKLYRLEHGLEQALEEKVWLKSGGFLIIQQTEAFVAIDVNSGKYMSKKQAEEEYKKINLEAAKEIARQLRLRNLYGMILIDFINMNQYEDRTELLRAMKNFVRGDRITTTVVDVTPLGIMELTRKKEEKSIREQVFEVTGGDRR